MSKIISLKVVAVVEEDDGSKRDYAILDRKFGPDCQLLELAQSRGFKKDWEGKDPTELPNLTFTGVTTLVIKMKEPEIAYLGGKDDRHKNTVMISVNGTDSRVPQIPLAYDAIFGIAYPSMPQPPTKKYKITYNGGPESKRSGELDIGEEVIPVHGMAFNVREIEKTPKS